jgi:hypothetical protein
MIDLSVRIDLRHAYALIERYPEAARAAQISRITEAALMAEQAIKEHTPVGAGPIHLRDTIFHKINATGTPIWGVISTPLAYGEPVEVGTRPHFPPIDPIAHWVEKKIGASGKEARSIAFLIARAISRRGTKGAKMFQISFEELNMKLLDVLGKIPDDIVRMVGGGKQ